jgi:dTDP-4-dehydrorhamnose reductase
MSNRPILVLGASGNVGRHLVKLLGDSCVGLTHHQFDLSKLEDIEQKLEKFDVAAVINAGAYTDADTAENEEPLVTKINGIAPGIIARWCTRKEIPFVHYSTDYVYSGEGDKPWVENDNYSPLNVYGCAKAEGDLQVASSKGNWLIFRVEWVYDYQGRNFLTTILHQAKELDEIEVVDDQHGAPTYALHIAMTSIKGLQYAVNLSNFPSGIYHLCNEGETTWFDFAEAILVQAKKRGIKLRAKTIKPVKTSDYPSLAPRPLNSRLSSDKAKNILKVKLPRWEAALDECFDVVARRYKIDPNTNPNL